MKKWTWWILGGGMVGVIALAVVRLLDDAMSAKDVPRNLLLGSIPQRGEAKFEFPCPAGKGFCLVWGCPSSSAIGGVSFTVALTSSSGATEKLAVAAADLTKSNWLDDQKLTGYIIKYGKRLDVMVRQGEHCVAVVEAKEGVPSGTSLWLSYLAKYLPSE
jgi:hypothetical protein